MPADVVAFRSRRERCEHFQGEDAYNRARAWALNAAVRRYCTGADAALASLRRRYRHDPNVTAALAGYEARIE